MFSLGSLLRCCSSGCLHDHGQLTENIMLIWYRRETGIMVTRFGSAGETVWSRIHIFSDPSWFRNKAIQGSSTLDSEVSWFRIEKF